jgi:hypothetical protein
MILRINWREAHHGYIGLYLAALGLHLAAMDRHPVIGGIEISIGMILIIDDLYQHRRQVADPLFESILTLAFRDIWGVATGLIQKWFGITITYPQFLTQRRAGHAQQ